MAAAGVRFMMNSWVGDEAAGAAGFVPGGTGSWWGFNDLGITPIK
jgi:hypothetical protein